MDGIMWKITRWDDANDCSGVLCAKFTKFSFTLAVDDDGTTRHYRQGLHS